MFGQDGTTYSSGYGFTLGGGFSLGVNGSAMFSGDIFNPSSIQFEEGSVGVGLNYQSGYLVQM